MPALSTQIVIAGAGPVGMSVAIEAALRGIKVVLIEARKAGEPPSAKCNTVAARTMEIFRRFGVADSVRAAGLPDDYPTDVIYCTGITGAEITRIRMPSRRERGDKGFDDSDWPTPEPVVRVSQLYLEPILYARVRALANITVLNNTTVDGYQQDESGVSVACRDGDGAELVIRGRFLIGCDGGRSTIRKAMCVSFVGDPEIARTRSTLVRAPAIRALFGKRRPAWMSWVVNHKVRGNVVAIDGKDTWLIHRALPPGVTDFEALDFDQSLRDVLGVGEDFAYEVLNHEDWVGRRLIAERFRDRNVFLAGDAAHIWLPFAGYGMNAGIADGVNLAWHLSSYLHGWAGEAVLAAYEAERKPITEQVSLLAIDKVMENAEASGRRKIPKALAGKGPAGWILRGVLGRRLHRVNVPQFAPAGLNFGYFYEGSPLIAYDGETAPRYTMGEAMPSTVPGCRLPHFRLADGTSIYDKLGSDYTLIRFDKRNDISAVAAAAARAKLPLSVVDAARPNIANAFRHALVLVRVDQHVAWRGNALPRDCGALVDRLRGVTLARAQATAA